MIVFHLYFFIDEDCYFLVLLERLLYTYYWWFSFSHLREVFHDKNLVFLLFNFYVIINVL